MRRKVVLGKRATLPAKSTLVSIYMRKKLTPLPESRAGFPMTVVLAHVMIILSKLTWLGKPKWLYGEKFAWLGG